MEIEEIKKEIVKIMRGELVSSACNGCHAFFFGSRVLGTATPRSDIDVGIECGAGAGTTRVDEHILRTIRSRCEALPTLYKIDVVDFSLLTEDFKKVAKQKIERIV